MNNLGTIHDLFEDQVEKAPDAIAIQFQDQTLTYRTLNAKANQLSHYLREMGVKPEVPVAICMDRSIELLIAMLGILKAGGAYVPLDASHPEERLLFQLNDNNSPILVLKSNIKEKFIQYSGKTIELDTIEAELSKQPILNPRSISSARDLAYIIYTSGSSGKPKGVLIEHQSVTNYSSWFADYCHCKPQERVDFSANYIFDMCVSVTIVPLLLGLQIVICSEEEKKNSRTHLNFLENNQINIIKMTPSYLKLLLHEIKNNFIALPHLRRVILGGENLPAIDCKSWLSIYPEHILYNEYGPTEATIAVSQHKVEHTTISSLDVNVPIGKPGPNMSCYILGADNLLLPNDVPGELAIGGIGLARSYLNQPELTLEKFISYTPNERLYKTGDLCQKLPDGTLEYLGRIDDQIKVHGFRIEPGEIEQCLVLHPAIDEVAVLVRDDQKNEKQLVAYYTLKSFNDDLDTNQIRQYMQAYLPKYMIPASFVRLKTFPLASSGKIDKSELPIPHFTTSQYYLAPSTDLEKILAGIWSDELFIKPIGTKDDFFELGGDSLSAARIISNINNILNKDLSLKDFYQAGNIYQLATVLNNTPQKISVTNRILYDEPSLFSLTDFQFLLWVSNTFEPKAKKLNIATRKRLQGRLDKTRLNFAFQAVLKKHEPLRYKIKTLYPVQMVDKNLAFNLIETTIVSVSNQESEQLLDASYNELLSHYPWKPPLLLARLFNMKNEITEIQLSMSHIISDEVSLEILLADLSHFYLLYDFQPNINEIHTNIHFRDYLFQEYQYSQMNLERDIAFWDNYLKKVSLFTFPSGTIVKNRELNAFTYSTFMAIPEQSLINLQKFCASQHVSIHDSLCAALALALCKPQRKTQSLFMNIVKSTRNKKEYDDIIGCFLRIEPIKIDLNKKSTLASLSQQVRESVIKTNPYQGCSSSVKLASLSEFRKKGKSIKSGAIKILVLLYTTLFPSSKLHPKILNLYLRLSSLKKINRFLINMNVQSNFILNENRKRQHQHFGLEPQNTERSFSDSLTIDFVLDVRFMRMEPNDIPYLIISANLKPAFRELIAKKAIQIISGNALVN